MRPGFSPRYIPDQMRRVQGRRQRKRVLGVLQPARVRGWETTGRRLGESDKSTIGGTVGFPRRLAILNLRMRIVSFNCELPASDWISGREHPGIVDSPRHAIGLIRPD